jgi:outer membrane lipoprotein LolB
MRFFFLLSVLLIAGCTAVPKISPVTDPDTVWQNHQQDLATLQSWRLKGRIAIRNDHESWFLKVDWQQQPEKYDVLLSGPFSGMVRLSSNNSRVELSDGEQSYRAYDAETLLLEHTGIRMPVNGLRYWVLGLPQPDKQVKALQLDVAGRLASLEQDEWQVSVDSYQQYNGKTLPAKLIIKNHHLNVRLIVDQWLLISANS